MDGQSTLLMLKLPSYRGSRLSEPYICSHHLRQIPPNSGNCDAHRAWYQKLSDELTKVGATKSSFDSALFFWRKSSKLEGIICCHVDDCFFVGSDLFHQTIIAHLRSTFSLSKKSSKSFSFLGLEMQQNSHSVVIHQNNYIQNIKPINKDSSSLTRSLTHQETRQLKALVGQIQWVAKQTRPDAAYTACELNSGSCSRLH